MAKTSGGIRSVSNNKNTDTFDLSDLKFDLDSMNAYSGPPARTRTNDERYWGYVNGRMAYYTRHGHL